jgi:uncharacterized phage infection (PIP) family protein YhgE
MADEWRNTEAQILNGTSQQYKAIANALNQNLERLKNISNNIHTNIVTGPPADVLKQKSEPWQKSLKSAIDKLRDGASQMEHKASDWQRDYKDQKQKEADDERKKKEQEAKSKAGSGFGGGGGGSW